MVHAFPKGICPKVKVIAWLKFEIAYYDSRVHCFTHYTTRTPSSLESEWQQVSSNLLDSSQYSVRKLQFEWSRLVLRCPTLPASSLSVWGSFRVHQLQLASPSPSGSIAFLVLWQGKNTCLSFRFLWFLLDGLPEWQNPLHGRFYFFVIYDKVRFSIIIILLFGDFFTPVLADGF